MISVNDQSLLYQLTDVITNNFISNPTEQQIDTYLDTLFTATNSYLVQTPGEIALNCISYMNNQSKPINRQRTKKKLDHKKKGDEILGILGAIIGFVAGVIAGVVVPGASIVEWALIGTVMGFLILPI